MIGNSPKSDVDAALEVSLGTAFDPHVHTWTLLWESIREGYGRLLILRTS